MRWSSDSSVVLHILNIMTIGYKPLSLGILLWYISIREPLELGADLATFHYIWPQCHRLRLSSFWNTFVSRHQCNWEPSALCQSVNKNSSLFNWDHCKREAGANGSLLCSPWGHDRIDGTIDHLWEGSRQEKQTLQSPWWEWTLQGHHENLLLNILIPVILKSQTIGLETVILGNYTHKGIKI